MTYITFKEVREFKHRINPEERQGSYGYYFMRRLSIFLTWLLFNLGFTANQVTTLQILCGVIGCVFLAFPQIEFLVLGVLFLQLGFLFDNVDGEIARLRKQVSITGKFLDTLGHEIVVPFMYFGLAIGSYFRTGHFEVMVFGFLAGLFSLRFDIAALYLEAGRMLESQLEKAFDYYTDIKKEAPGEGAPLRVYRQKNEPTLSRIIYAVFAYPATMNIFSVAILAQIFIPNVVILNTRVELVYILLVGYGTLIPLRRVAVLFRLVARREPERKYLDFLETRDSLVRDNL